ncbi:MAG TPA: hypothetical protein ENJ20_01980 [Bacteroidetes bacterium]|nr:hypothetical protein [Bacteroidota bacterium]
MLLRTILAFAMAGVLFSCSNDKPDTQQTPEQDAQQQPQQQVATLPSVPLELLQRIFKEGTQIDYIYHYYPFTASLNEKAAIQNAMRHIAETPAPIKPECKPAGIITYQIDGDIVLRGDFYFDSGCTFFVFYDKDNNKYANYMTQDGVDFFNMQIQQATELRKRAQQQQQQ